MESDQSEQNKQQMNSADWSHVRETVNMLYLAVCQIEATLEDSNRSVNTLTESFTALAGHTQSVSDQVQNLTEPSELNAFKKDITETAQELKDNISSSVQAFQFYDRVCQRLDHVARSLESVSDLLSAENKKSCPDEWKSIQGQIKSSYTMDAERIMYEFIMRGGQVKEALEIYKHHFDQSEGNVDQDNDEIELF